MKIISPVIDMLDVNKKKELEEPSITIKFTCDKAFAYEMFQLAGDSVDEIEECSSEDGEIIVIQPEFLQEGTDGWWHWKKSCEEAEKAYFNLLNWGCSNKQAATVLPLSLKTKISITLSMRGWQHFFNARPVGVPMLRLLKIFKARLPEMLIDIK